MYFISSGNLFKNLQKRSNIKCIISSIKLLKYFMIYLIVVNLLQTNKFFVNAEPSNNLVNAEVKDIQKRSDNEHKFEKHHDSNDNDDDDDDSREHKNDDDSKELSNKEFEKALVKKNLGFIHAFIASFSVILVSEIGDKTFFIAAIMAMKYPRLIIYFGAMFALGLMTLLSALLGNVVTQLIPKSFTYYASSFLFAIFGFKMLYDGWKMSTDDHGDDEYEEAQESLREAEKSNQDDDKDVEIGVSDIVKNEIKKDNCEKAKNLTRKIITRFRKYVSPIFLQAFILTFLAEWGDRSQISTIILGARENIVGVIIGGILGHGICTGAGVIGGRFLAQHISIRTVTLCGAFVFLFFACSAIFIGPDAV